MAQGLTRRQATRVLEPLARQTLDRGFRLGPRATAPGSTRARRAQRIARGAQAFSRFPRPYRDAYVALERLRASLAESGGAPKKSPAVAPPRALAAAAGAGKQFGGENS
jgi:hypothetical protein